MINIICDGCELEDVDIPLSALRYVLDDNYIPEDSFIEFRFDDGSRGIVRKRNIIAAYGE